MNSARIHLDPGPISHVIDCKAVRPELERNAGWRGACNIRMHATNNYSSSLASPDPWRSYFSLRPVAGHVVGFGGGTDLRYMGSGHRWKMDSNCGQCS